MNKIRKNAAGFSAVEALVVVVVLVVLVVLGGIGYLVYKSHHKPVKTTASNTVTTSTKTTPKTDSYEGWKTFTSNKEGLSFRYPANWTVQTETCLNPTTQSVGECTTIRTPQSANSSYVFNINYNWNASDEASKTAGNTYVTSSTPLNISGSKTPLYLAATNVGSGDKLIYGLEVVNQNYTAGMVQKVTTVVPSQKDSSIFFSFEASMRPAEGTQVGVGYTEAQYQAQPDYASVVKLFRSVKY
jgi:hypothetical protein